MCASISSASPAVKGYKINLTKRKQQAGKLIWNRSLQWQKHWPQGPQIKNRDVRFDCSGAKTKTCTEDLSSTEGDKRTNDQAHLHFKSLLQTHTINSDQRSSDKHISSVNASGKSDSSLYTSLHTAAPAVNQKNSRLEENEERRRTAGGHEERYQWPITVSMKNQGEMTPLTLI